MGGRAASSACAMNHGQTQQPEPTWVSRVALLVPGCAGTCCSCTRGYHSWLVCCWWVVAEWPRPCGEGSGSRE